MRQRTFHLLFVVVVLCSVLRGQPVTVYPGSASDSGYSNPPTCFQGGVQLASCASTAYTIPVAVTALGTNTLRYGPQFTYTFTMTGKPGLYALVLGFVEPTVQAAGQRVFSIAANDQPIVQNMDLFVEAGYLGWTTRSSVVFISGPSLILTFSASVRNAVVSSITLLSLGFGSVTTPLAASTAALNIINTQCTRCHGNDIVPGDVSLVDGLDLRSVSSMVAGGGRGPALVPGRSDLSFIYVFTAFQSRLNVPPSLADVAALDALDVNGFTAVGMPPFGRMSQEDVSTIKAWIDYGAPLAP